MPTAEEYIGLNRARKARRIANWLRYAMLQQLTSVLMEATNEDWKMFTDEMGENEASSVTREMVLDIVQMYVSDVDVPKHIADRLMQQPDDPFEGLDDGVDT